MAQEKQQRETPAPAGVRESIRIVRREHPRFVATSAILILILFLLAIGGAGIAVWKWRGENQARKAEQQAVEKNKKAEEETKKVEGKLKRSEEEEKERRRERDRAQEAVNAARHSEEEMQAILAFLKNNLLAAGRSGDVSLKKAFWAGIQDKNLTVRKDLTLRQAVDETVAKVVETFADRPRAEASVREMLGLAYLNLGAAKEAVQQYERAFELREAMYGDSASETADCRNQLAVAYRLADRPDDASHLFHRRPDSSAHASALAVRGAMLLAQKKPAEAELKLRESLIIRQKLQPDAWTLFEAKSLLGQALLDQKKYSKAEPLLLLGYKGMKKREDQIPSQEKTRLAKALERLVRLYDTWGKEDKAEKWRKELSEPSSSDDDAPQRK